LFFLRRIVSLLFEEVLLEPDWLHDMGMQPPPQCRFLEEHPTTQLDEGNTASAGFNTASAGFLVVSTGSIRASPLPVQ